MSAIDRLVSTRRIVQLKHKKPRPVGMKKGVGVRQERKMPLTDEEKRLHRERNKKDEDKVDPRWREALRKARNNGIIGSTDITKH